MAQSADSEDSVEEMCWAEAERGQINQETRAFNTAITHLLHGQAALRTREPLSHNGPQVRLPQTSTVHLRGQRPNLGCGALTGFVGQLEDRGTNE